MNRRRVTAACDLKIGQSITASELALGIASLTYCVCIPVAFGHCVPAGRANTTVV
jgi:hypothetical protein